MCTLIKEFNKKGIELKPLNVLYWTRFCLGIVAAALCAVLGLFLYLSLWTGLSVGLVFYIGTNYLLKGRFLTKVKDASKVLTTGIGAYFLTWLVVWVLLFSLLNFTA